MQYGPVAVNTYGYAEPRAAGDIFPNSAAPSERKDSPPARKVPKPHEQTPSLPRIATFLPPVTPLRAATANPPAEVAVYTAEWLSLIPAKTQTELLLTAIKIHPDIAGLANTFRAIEAQKHALTEERFDSWSKEIWYLVNKRHRRLSSSKLYEVAEDAKEEVLSAVNEGIVAKVKSESSFATKRNALETLRKIGKTCWLAETDYVSDKVGDGEVNDAIGEGMVKIARWMTEEERGGMEEGWAGKLRELIEFRDRRDNYFGSKEMAETLRLFGEEVEEREKWGPEDGRYY
jgi:hypothetical protein